MLISCSIHTSTIRDIKPHCSYLLFLLLPFLFLFLFPTMAQATPKTPLLNKKPPVSRPKYKRRRSSFDPSTYNSTQQPVGYVKPSDIDPSLPGLNLMKIIALTLCMGGVQFTCKYLECFSSFNPFLFFLSFYSS
ncbi:hypothetical protein BDF14DRAFT_1132122 [Spinellus fusiger]|nr:hypothetical protein BDF14DRAFT_1132122 [Spinellus fusiger]